MACSRCGKIYFGLFVLLLLITCASSFLLKNPHCSLQPARVVSALAVQSESPDDDETRHLAAIQVAQTRMKNVMTNDFFESSSTLRTFFSKVCKTSEVKESNIAGAGLGLFARKAVKANTIVSFYPAHALGLDSEQSDCPFYSDDPYFDRNRSSSSSYLHCTDQPLFNRKSVLSIDDETASQPPPLFLDVNPNLPLIDGWLSQMINDGAMVHRKTEQGVLDYYQLSKNRRNCIHIPFGPSPIIATVTTKKVKKGDELLTTYGGIYWLGTGNLDPALPDVGVTPPIGAEIRATANELVASLKKMRTVYVNQEKALQEAYENL